MTYNLSLFNLFPTREKVVDSIPHLKQEVSFVSSLSFILQFSETFPL